MLCSTSVPSHKNALALVTTPASMGAAFAATPAIPRMDPTRQPLVVDHMCAWRDAISLFRKHVSITCRACQKGILCNCAVQALLLGAAGPGKTTTVQVTNLQLEEYDLKGRCCFVWLENKWPFRPLPGFRKKKIAKAWRQNLVIQQCFGWDAET